MPCAMLIARQLQRRSDRWSPVRSARRGSAHRPTTHAVGVVRRASSSHRRGANCLSPRSSPTHRQSRQIATTILHERALTAATLWDAERFNFAGPRPTATDVSRGLEYCRTRTTTRYSARSYEDTCRAAIRPFSPACCTPLSLGSRCWAVCRVAAHFEDLDSRKPPSQLLSGAVHRRCCDENSADHARVE